MKDSKKYKSDYEEFISNPKRKKIIDKKYQELCLSEVVLALMDKEAISIRALALGLIGSQTSRLRSAANNLVQTRENYQAAEARITNVDVAEESSSYIRTQIPQQTGASILAQANQAPALALQLLR